MKYLIYGYYGYNNLGDELLLNTIIQQITLKDNDAIFNILNKSSKTLTKYKNVHYSNIRDILHNSNKKISKFINFFYKFKQYIDETDVFIIGGGTLLMDIGKFNFLMMYLSFFVKYAKLKNKKVILLGLGIDILGTPFSNIWAKRILENSDIINLRDKLSYQIANKIDVQNNRINLTQDLVFSNLDFQNCQNNIKKHNYIIGISLIDYSHKFNNNDFIERVNNIINYYLDNKYIVKLLSFQTDFDKADNLFYSKLNRVSECNIINLTLVNLKEEYESLDYVLSMRFHGILLGLLFNKKVLGIVHEIKNFQLCLDTNIDYILLENLNIDTILTYNYKEIDNMILNKLKSLADKNFDFMEKI